MLRAGKDVTITAAVKVTSVASDSICCERVQWQHEVAAAASVTLHS